MCIRDSFSTVPLFPPLTATVPTRRLIGSWDQRRCQPGRTEPAAPAPVSMPPMPPTGTWTRYAKRKPASPLIHTTPQQAAAIPVVGPWHRHRHRRRRGRRRRPQTLQVPDRVISPPAIRTSAPAQSVVSSAANSAPVVLTTKWTGSTTIVRKRPSKRALQRHQALQTRKHRERLRGKVRYGATHRWDRDRPDPSQAATRYTQLLVRGRTRPLRRRPAAGTAIRAPPELRRGGHAVPRQRQEDTSVAVVEGHTGGANALLIKKTVHYTYVLKWSEGNPPHDGSLPV